MAPARAQAPGLSARPERRQWRSLGEYERGTDPDTSTGAGPAEDLRPEDGDLAGRSVSRRAFIGGAGITAAAAAAALSGCIRKPREEIVPAWKRPEDLVPGEPVWFATSARFGDQVLGLLVESQDGRPTKVEGNPRHPDSLGGTNPQAQACLLDLYDPDRSRAPRRGGVAATWDEFSAWALPHFDGLHQRGGRGLALLLEDWRSPTVLRLLSDLRSRFGQMQIFVDDVALRANAAQAADMVGLGSVSPRFDLRRADVVVALDADFLGTERDSVRLARQFADGRRVDAGRREMNRLYAVEARLSITGMMADHRLRLRSAQVGELLLALAEAVFAAGLLAPPGTLGLVPKLGARVLPAAAVAWARAVARDLVSRPARSAVIVGERQPPWAHALAYLVNIALRNLGTTLAFVPRHEIPGARDLRAMVQAALGGEIDTLLAFGTNPVYAAPGDLRTAEALSAIEDTVHLGMWFDETAAACAWHLPRSHFLESWGDHRASDGTVSVQQPLIAPLHDTRSTVQMLDWLANPTHFRGMEQVQATWSRGASTGGFEERWRRWLHEGIAAGTAATPIAPALIAPVFDIGDSEVAPPLPANAFAWSQLGSVLEQLPEPDLSGIEVDFYPDTCVYDGRYANNTWLQELPDPVTKLTWDNAALLSPATARRLGVPTGDVLPRRGDLAPMVAVTLGDATIELPAWVTPGLADDVVALALGRGRTADLRYAKGSGFDVSKLRSSVEPWFRGGGDVRQVPGGYGLCSAQDFHRLVPRPGWEPRPVVREWTLDKFVSQPGSDAGGGSGAHEAGPLFVPSNATSGQQWAMSIDLNVCTGCAACVVACQAENNIPSVGRERAGYGRLMHWVRIDRYFVGDADDPQVVVQPVACVQCELAPCEQVCPVAATAHSPDGLNDMAYNRCIGTRYCAANCPYKARRFNFFAYGKEQDESSPLIALQRNPDVTVRFRGVMEKCTYCVQRINAEKIAAKRDFDGVVADGRIVPACAEACPTRAIVFGDIADPASAVSKARARPQEYALLSELGVRPRTTYGGKIRNLNPELA